MRQQLLFLKTLAVGFILLMGVTAKGATYFVKTNGSSAWANVSGGTVKELASGNAITAFTTINAAATGADTYYFAPGTYNINGVLPLTTGQIYGGFSGNETSISDLTTRLTSDLDGNGIVEPWELSNVVTFTITTFTYSNATGTANRTLSVTGTGGEVNGITFYDINYNTTGGNGAILLGEVSSAPSDGFNTAKAGKLTQCIVRQIKNSTAYGVVMITNANSVVDKCLIEDSRVIAGNGTIFMNKYGGTVSNSVIRNNIVSAYGGAIWMGATTGNSVDASANAIVSNCAIYNNTAGTNGGAIRAEALNSTGAKGIQIVNCTVVNNKTTTSSSASLELVNSGLIANTISLSDPYYEIRPTQATNYVINDVFGTNTGGTLYPSTGHNNTSGIADNTFTALNFKNPTAFQGAVGNSISDVATYTDALKSQIKNANYYITSTSSKAYTTYSTNYVSLPSSFKAAGGTGSSIAITATVPSSDINGDSRNTIGAYNYDGTAPTVTINSSATSPTSTSPIPVTFTFSENVTGFTTDDVTVGNGTLSAITAVSGKVYTATITPTGSVVTVDVPANGIKDGAGNDNTAATQFSITYGAVSTAPVGVTTTAISGIGSTSATSGVSYTSTGGSAIKEYGVVWSTSTNPDANAIAATKTTNGSGAISGLAHNTIYYVKAYATNAIGTSYGSELSFTTKWAITASAGTSDGTVTGGGDYANNASVTLSATATASGKRFMNWTASGNVVSISKSYTFTATSDKTVVANFSDVKTTYYVRPSGSSAWGNIGASADQIITATDAANNFNLAFLANNLPDGTATYYMAAGNYTLVNVILNQGTQLTTGKIYGGFTGNESSIDLNARATSDLDGNGVIEPWEMTNATVVSGNTGLKYAEAGSGATGERLIRLDNGAEVNGVTLTDYNYGNFGGAISVGTPATTPTNNGAGYEGYLKRCIVRKIKSYNGAVMSTNTNSVIDQCLIEDCYGTHYGAIYMNRFGGAISNSVIRNNYSTTYGGAIYAGNSASSTDLKAVVKNCVIYNNSALTNGGAIRADANSTTTGGIEIINSTIANNATIGSGVASVELINNGLLANSIVIGDSNDELRANSTSNYVLSSAYGTLVSGNAIWPASNTVTGKIYSDFGFVTPTTFSGYVGITGDAGFNQTNFDNVHKANFSINSNSTSSAAITTVGVSSIPSSYLALGGTGASVAITALVANTDITGQQRTGAYTIGAYQGATLDISNGSPVTINQDKSLANVTVAPGAQLTLASGKTLTVGTITLQSDATGTATFVNNGTATITSATVNQYLPSARNWYISSPISGATVPNGSSYLYYDEPQTIVDVDHWISVTEGNQMAVGKGYIAQPASASTLIYNGTLNDGNYTINLTKTHGVSKSGFNLVGNPYPSYLSWDDVVKNNVESNIWYRSRTNKNVYKFMTYNSLGQLATDLGSTLNPDSVATKNIPPMQAFWVRAKAPVIGANINDTIGSIQLTNAMRNHKGTQGGFNDGVLRSKTQNTNQVLRLQVSNGTNTDDAIIYTNSAASNSYDDYDSQKMSNNSAAIPEIYTMVGTDNLSINGLNNIQYDIEIPLGFNTLTAGSFSIKASQFSNFDVGTRIVLKDYLNINYPAITDLSDGSSYSFTSDISSNNTSRFTLIFKAPSVATEINSTDNNRLWISANANGQIQVNGISNAETTVSVYNSLGQKLLTKNLLQANEQSGIKLQAGVYMVSVTTAGKTITKKVIID